MSPRQILSVVRPVEEDYAAGRSFAVEFGEPFDRGWGRHDWLRLVSFSDSLLKDSVLSVAVNATFAEWVERHTSGERRMTVTGLVFYAKRKRVEALLMPVRIPAHGLLASVPPRNAPAAA